jgi:lipopolysaccharide biosynthesis protein
LWARKDTERVTTTNSVRAIAFYLPQFHPIPENDQWWGNGFTEWTNVTKAKPLFPGHYQPRIPADLGYYDLRVPETRQAQAQLARQRGIEGFCYWHYWFGGKRLLETPFQEVLRSGDPDFPFCLGWANQSWTGIWHGQPTKVLIEQTYPGEEDDTNHFYSVLQAFSDKRYIQVDGKPLFVVYMPGLLPDPPRFTNLWNELAIKAGLQGIHFVGIADHPWSETPGFDGHTYHLPGTFVNAIPERKLDALLRKMGRHNLDSYLRGYLKLPRLVRYSTMIRHGFSSIQFGSRHYPCVLPNWDNTARSGLQGLVLLNSTPELFRLHLREALKVVRDRHHDHRIVFIKSWNEWAEGNYLEPDLRFGSGYLDVLREEVSLSCIDASADEYSKQEPASSTYAA